MSLRFRSNFATFPPKKTDHDLVAISFQCRSLFARKSCPSDLMRGSCTLNATVRIRCHGARPPSCPDGRCNARVRDGVRALSDGCGSDRMKSRMYALTSFVRKLLWPHPSIQSGFAGCLHIAGCVRKRCLYSLVRARFGALFGHRRPCYGASTHAGWAV